MCIIYYAHVHVPSSVTVLDKNNYNAVVIISEPLVTSKKNIFSRCIIHFILTTTKLIDIIHVYTCTCM